MRKGSADLNERLCPACGQQAGRDRGRKNTFQLLSCRTCATLYTAESPGPGQWEDYDAYYTPENLMVPDFINRRLDEIVATFKSYRKSNRLLDVGCGAGSFLEAAARDNWEAFGVEISQTAADHVRKQGFEVFCGELEKADYPDGYFDVVIASEVLEHVLDPKALLESVARVLRPGGLLWATTPHGRGISARLLDLAWTTVCPPEHLQLFSVKSIKAVLSSAGFRRVEVVTHGMNPFEIVHELHRRFLRRAEVQDGNAAGETFNRVESGYQLNEFVTKSYSRGLLKATLNSLLNTGRIGDSLKIHAEK
jgi:2-polyprenyl-3-methyl-5-hydroxy-6-metoxy-1,4-benzoquinol methylase